MSESTAGVSRGFPILRKSEANFVLVLVALMKNRDNIGLTEPEVVKQSALCDNEALAALAQIEREGYVRSFICQMGTSGPYARRYKLLDNISIKIEISLPLPK